MAFSDDFWQSVRQTSDILRSCVPLCDSEQADQLRQAYESAAPETRAHKKHELKMLIARLIQVDRLLEED
jgi:hypothetical protein